MARKKGEGSISLKKGKYFYGITINGKRKRKALKATTRQDAEQEAKQFIKATTFEDQIGFAVFKAETKKLIQASNAPDISELFEIYEGDKNRPDCIEKTLNQHKKYWTEFIDWLGGCHPGIRNINEIDSSIVNQFFTYVNDELSGAAYNYRRNSLKLIYKTVAPDSINPFASIRKKKTETQIKKILDEKSFWKIIEVFKDDRFYLAYKNEYEVLFYIAGFTGMRLKDCCLLKWDMVNFEYSTVLCIPEKTRQSSGRLVEISLIQDLKEKLIQAQSWKKNDYILPDLARIYQRGHDTISKETKRVINWALSKDDDLKSTSSSLRKLENQYDYSFHSLRHAFASFCYRNGISIDKVKDILGHTSTIVTRIYAHADPEDLKKIASAIPSRYGQQKTPEEKLKEIKRLISSKDRLTQTDKSILEIIR